MGQSRCVGVVQAMVGSIGTSRDLAYTVSPSHPHTSPLHTHTSPLTQDLKADTDIDLENIVYYKDDTHYFVMTAKKDSLLRKGVLINVRGEGGGEGVGRRRKGEEGKGKR